MSHKWKSTLSHKPVRGRSVGTTEWTDYPSVNEAAKKLGLNKGAVSACCTCKQNQTGGYEFELAAQAEPELLEGEEWRDVVLENWMVEANDEF